MTKRTGMITAKYLELSEYIYIYLYSCKTKANHLLNKCIILEHSTRVDPLMTKRQGPSTLLFFLMEMHLERTKHTYS